MMVCKKSWILYGFGSGSFLFLSKDSRNYLYYYSRYLFGSFQKCKCVCDTLIHPTGRHQTITVGRKCFLLYILKYALTSIDMTLLYVVQWTGYIFFFDDLEKSRHCNFNKNDSGKAHVSNIFFEISPGQIFSRVIRAVPV